MKEFYVITTGTSLLRNFSRSPKAPQWAAGQPDTSEVWKEVLDNPGMIQAILDFLEEDPKAACAEANAFLSLTEDSQGDKEIWMSGTKTTASELVVRVLEKWFTGLGYRVLNTKEFAGYFEAEIEEAASEFQADLVQLLDTIVYLASKKKAEGYRVVILPIGGFKAQVIVAGLAGFLTHAEMGYIHEQFREPIWFPKGLYLPRGNELDLLRAVYTAGGRVEGTEAYMLGTTYEDALERLQTYHMIVARFEEGKCTSIQLTPRGLEVIGDE